jgi:FSR family fosmidomycin resistance protein-like MFS transporter
VHNTVVTELEADSSQPPSSQFDAASVLTLAAAHTVHDTFQGFLPPLLPAFIANLAMSKAEAGILASLLEIPTLLQPAIGHLADRVNLRFLIFLGPAMTAVMMSLLGIAPSYRALAVLLSIAGFSRAAFHAVGPVVAGQSSGRRLGQGMGMWMIGGQLGPALAPILVVTVVRVMGLTGLPWLMILGLLSSTVLYLRVRSMPVQRIDSNLQPITRQALRSMGSLMLLVGVIVTLRSVLTAAINVYLPTFLTEGGADLWFAGASMSLTHGASTLGVLLTGSLSDHLGRRRMLYIAYLVGPAFMWLFLEAHGWVQVVTLFFLGLTALSTMPVLMALVQELFPENRSLASGLYLTIVFIIQSIMAVVVGATGDRLGLRWAFSASAAIMLLGLPLIRLLPDARTVQQGKASSPLASGEGLPSD